MSRREEDLKMNDHIQKQVDESNSVKTKELLTTTRQELE
jgi:hypothetical protein